MTFPLNAPMFDLLVLSVIAESDAYGYQISQIIKRAANTKDSTLYPILRRLQNSISLRLMTSSIRAVTGSTIPLRIPADIIRKNCRRNGTVTRRLLMTL